MSDGRYPERPPRCHGAARFAVAVVAQSSGEGLCQPSGPGRQKLYLDIVQAADAITPADAVAHAERMFLGGNPSWEIIGSLCEAIPHG